jgi:chromosome segregation ATPase
MELANDPTRMIFTFQDIQQRQKLIDRLMQELEARTEAVKKIGSDLYESRQKNANQEIEMSTMKKTIQDNDIRTVKLLNTIDIDVLPLDEIKRRYALLAQKLQIEINRTRDLTDKLDIAQKSKIERNELEKKYLELRHAHKAQSTHIQTLQDRLQETQKFKNSIKRQEQVIQKLEVLLKDSMKGSENQTKLDAFFSNAKINPDSFDGGVYRLLTEENQMLKDKLLKLERSSVYSILLYILIDTGDPTERLHCGI